ncbi:MAG: DNRLRE domain-containing protein, partial [Planctomycetota bacterium]
KWDLSALPSDTVVAEATLYLYQVDSRGDVAYDAGAHKIINVDPNITTCTWNTYDGVNNWTGGANGGQGDIASAEDIPGLNNTDNEYKAWRVTNMVQDWVSVPANNFGMLVNSDDTALVDHYRFFASTDEANTSIRPKLVVTYISGS